MIWPPQPAQVAQAQPWRIVWSDEFNEGTRPDPGKWGFDLGGSGFGNHELECYTDRAENTRVEGGHLVIEARREKFAGRDYTSGRIKTLGHFAQRYGRFEASIQLPKGQGMWPAFWMLGDNITRDGWPACGEIDIMEYVGKDPNSAHGTVHGPGYSGAHGITSTFHLENPRGFHLYAVEWGPELIEFSVDGHPYKRITPSELPAGGKWVFDRPFFLILNLAVGGDWPGSPDATTRFPQKMLVDYVRAYER